MSTDDQSPDSASEPGTGNTGSPTPDPAGSSVESVEAAGSSAAPVEDTRVATLRRAPKFKAFFTVGALVGVVLGIVLGVWVSYDGMINRWIYVVVTVAGTTLVTVLIAGIWASVLDRRSASARPTPPSGTATVDAPGA